MNGFFTLTDMWLNAIADIIEFGHVVPSRAGDTYEIGPYRATLTNIHQNFVLNPTRKADPAYAAAEFLWYMSGDASGSMMAAYAPQYTRFCEEDGTAFGAYGPRISKELPALIQLLRDKPNTRQAVLLIWKPTDIFHAEDVNDMPCTIALHFLIRDGRLHCLTYMRSNDLWLGMPYDVFCFTMLQRHVADELKLAYGHYIHHASSLHIYKRDFAKLQDVKSWPCGHLDHDWDRQFTRQDIQSAVNMEKKVRLNEPISISDDDLYAVNQSAAHDLFICCANKWRKTAVMPHSDILAAAHKIKYEGQQ